MKSKLLKGGLTVLGAIFVSTLGIFASDGLRGIDNNMLGLTSGGESGPCRAGMVAMKQDVGILCVDIYEASPSEKCPHHNPVNLLETEKNANASECYAASVKGVQPWSYISLPQAQRMCAGAGKRLPKSDEWYRFALGTDSNSCIVKAVSRTNTGTEGCVSSVGAFDVVGNMWEWVDETVQGNMFKERALPEEGYVSSVDASGVAITSAENPDELYGADYVWSKNEGVFGMIRGGFYGSDTDAGLYTVNASVGTSFGSQGVGFRCVEDVI